MFAVIFLISSSCLAQEPPFILPPKAELMKIRGAILSTDKGKIYLRLFPESAPWHVANLKFLADRGYYRNRPFHLVELNYVIQTGSMNSRAASGPRYSLPPEFNNIKHKPGTVSMVRTPDDLDLSHERRSHASQFRIMLSDAKNMDGAYTVFGEVAKGMDVANKIREGDLVKDLVVYVQ